MNLKLRNRLTEILLKGLKGVDQTEALAFLAAYCQAVKACGSTWIRVKDLSAPKGKSLSNMVDLGIFCMDQGNASDPQVDLLPQFSQELDYLCGRAASYSRVFAKSRRRSHSLKDLDWTIRIGGLLFNEGLYFECHEFLEEFWRGEKGETKEFLQGIISLATALYHLEQGHRPSAVKLFSDAHRRLAAFGKAHRGLAIEALLEQTRKIQALVEEGGPVVLEQLKRMPLPKVEIEKN